VTSAEGLHIEVSTSGGPDGSGIGSIGYQGEREVVLTAPSRLFFAIATLLLATDGLLKYGRRDRIAVLARGADLQAAVLQLAELPRLRSGALPDDVGVILCRS